MSFHSEKDEINYEEYVDEMLLQYITILIICNQYISLLRTDLSRMGGWNQYMWLVSCRRQGMLTQGPAPDPKCKLNISSFLTLPHFSDCLICTRNSVSIILLL